MKHKLLEAMQKFSHDMAILELQNAYQRKENNHLSYQDILYLEIIDAHPNQYTSSQIADLLKVSRPAVTQKINELVKKGYITRTQSKTDKRVFYLSVNKENLDDFGFTEEEEIVVRKCEEKFGVETVDKMSEILNYISDYYFNQQIKGKNDE